MSIEQTVEKLHLMRLNGMAEALQQQLADPDMGTLSFEERLAWLGSYETSVASLRPPGSFARIGWQLSPEYAEGDSEMAALSNFQHSLAE